MCRPRDDTKAWYDRSIFKGRGYSDIHGRPCNKRTKGGVIYVRHGIIVPTNIISQLIVNDCQKIPVTLADRLRHNLKSNIRPYYYSTYNNIMLVTHQYVELKYKPNFLKFPLYESVIN